MGAIARTRADGLHEATGKLGIPEGTTHEPEWGEWAYEPHGLDMRRCHHPDCDIDDWRKSDW